jgi:phosphopantothenoylcysteine decarboxylase/phosphopantothenate--cysteine ligase
MKLKNKTQYDNLDSLRDVVPTSSGQVEVALLGKRILITAGSTWVAIDKVRVITNIFKGTLGIVIAREALKRGARATLLLGPGANSLPQIPFLKIIPFKFFNEFYRLMKKEISSKKYDIVIQSAAVSDFKPIKTEPGKISSQKEQLLIKLKPTLKIVDRIKKWDKNVFLVKFKLEHDINKKELLKKAYESMLSSNADLMVANDLKEIKEKAHKAFIIDQNKNVIFCQTKEEIAKNLLELLSRKIG